MRRRKHQKSKKGCTTCKRRHIRCDEKLPRCQHCIIHGSTCDYPEAHYEASSIFRPVIPSRAEPSVLKSINSDVKKIGELVPPTIESCPTSPRSDREVKRGEISLRPHLSSLPPTTAGARKLLAFCKLIIRSLIPTLGSISTPDVVSHALVSPWFKCLGVGGKR